MNIIKNEKTKDIIRAVSTVTLFLIFIGVCLFIIGVLYSTQAQAVSIGTGTGEVRGEQGSTIEQETIGAGRSHGHGGNTIATGISRTSGLGTTERRGSPSIGRTIR